MNAFEIDILKTVNSIISCDFLDYFFVFISSLGNKGAIWVATTLVLLLFKKTRKVGICSGIALALCLIGGNLFLKPVIGRIRPYAFDETIKLIIPPLSDASFPSGHTMAAFAFTVAITGYFKKQAILLYVTSSFMAFSRIYLMMHYPTDVAGGILIGILLGYLARKITERIFKNEV